MKIIALAAAALVAASALTPMPADAQRYGWNGNRHHGYNGWRGSGYRNWRGHRAPRYRGYRGNRWGYAYRPRQRVVCHTVRGYYGPARRCRTIWR